MFVCAPCARLVPQRPEEGVVAFGTEITDSWELPWRNRELNAGPSQSVTGSSELFFQALPTTENFKATVEDNYFPAIFHSLTEVLLILCYLTHIQMHTFM